MRGFYGKFALGKDRRDPGIWWLFIHHGGKEKPRGWAAEKTASEVAGKIQARLTLGEFKMDQKAEQRVSNVQGIR